MIDDQRMVQSLLRQIEAHLPIPARLTGAAARSLRSRGKSVLRDREVIIEKVYYAGDEGGIMCGLRRDPDSKEAVVISITHLRIPPQHPLAPEIRAYQHERIRRLASM